MTRIYPSDAQAAKATQQMNTIQNKLNALNIRRGKLLGEMIQAFNIKHGTSLSSGGFYGIGDNTMMRQIQAKLDCFHKREENKEVAHTIKLRKDWEAFCLKLCAAAGGKTVKLPGFDEYKLGQSFFV